jgi:hypothetical protein
MKRLSALLALALAVALSVLAVPAAGAATKHHMFASPSGNIGCYVNRHFARCDIAAHTWKAPQKPASCDFDWGDSLLLRRATRFGCISDTVLGARHVLRYGHSVRFGNKKCTSRKSGMVCRNLDTGHGFRLARDSYRRF